MKTRSQVFLSILIFAVLLFCFEGVQRVRHPFVGFRNMTNSLGFRSPEFNPQKAPGTYRILFIGGSTTYGVNGPAEETFPHLTGKILTQKSPGKKIEVINAALPGKNSYWVPGRIQETLYLNPDLVVVMIGENDCASVHQQFADLSRRGDLKIVSWQEKLSTWLAQRSVLYVTFREKLSILIHGKPDFAFDDPPDPRKELSENPEWFKFYPDYFEKNIEESIRLAKGHKIGIVFIQPPLSQRRRSQRPVYAQAYDVLMVKLQEMTSRQGIRLIQPDRFYEDLENTYSSNWDGIHLPQSANEKMAREISRTLVEHLKI